MEQEEGRTPTWIVVIAVLALALVAGLLCWQFKEKVREMVSIESFGSP